MRKVLGVIFVLVLISLSAMAADFPKAEIFGGYSYQSFDFKGAINRQSYNGWDSELAGNFSKNFGIVGDFSGYYKTIDLTKTSNYNFLFGPRVTVRGGKFQPFAHALFGVAHLTADGNSTNDFAMAFGGGADYSVNKNLSIRLAKFDYFVVRDSGESLNNVRISTGVVLKF